MSIAIELPDLDSATKELHEFPHGAEFAIRHALQDVAHSGKAAATAFIFQRYAFQTKGPISRSITVHSKDEFAVIRFSGTRFPIKLFLPSRTETGIDFMEVRGQRSQISQAFGSIMQYGFGIFKRKSPAKGPVQSQVGLSIANMAREATEIQPEMQTFINLELQKRLAFWISEVRKGNRGKYEKKGAKKE